MPTPLRARRARRAPLAAGGVLAAALALGACTGTAQSAAPAGTPTSGTSGASGATSYPLTVADCGTDVTFDAAPERVMTIGTDAIALLDAAGAGDRVVARSGEFGADLPDGLTDPPTDAVVVDPSDPTTEQIIGADVDVVVGYGFFNADPATLAQAGVRLLTVSAECGHDVGGGAQGVTFDTVLGDVERFGAVFDTAATAATAVDGLRERVEAATADDAGATRTAAAVYYFSSSAPLSAYGGAGILQSVLGASGLDNVYGDEPTPYLEVSVESLLAADPDVVVLVHGLHGDTFEEARARFLAEPGVADLQAVAADRVVGMVANQSTGSPAAVDGLEHLQASVAELG